MLSWMYLASPPAWSRLDEYPDVMDCTDSESRPDAGPEESHAADRLLAHKERLLERWVERVREEIPAATDERPPILVDTLPIFLRYLAEALSPHHPRSTATEGSTLAEEHGGERVRVTRYQLEDLIREYQLLREVLLDVLGESGALTESERHIITVSIDKAILESCTAFSLVHNGLREQFMLTLTHDLRGPLNAARLGAGMILRRPDAPHVCQWAARLVDNIERMERMIQDLLDVSRVRAGGSMSLSLAGCELVRIVQTVVDQLRFTHGERFQVIAPEPIHGYWSEEALTRAVENLVTNAVKYGESERPITLTVRQTHERAVVMVHNHGSYIPPEEQETLFQVFRRSRLAERSHQRGWGLGLALVRGVAEAHGGSIGVDSLPERGTTFTIDIPRDARPFQHCPTTG
jgi:signal transduction histidine kinase